MAESEREGNRNLLMVAEVDRDLYDDDGGTVVVDLDGFCSANPRRFSLGYSKKWRFCCRQGEAAEETRRLWQLVVKGKWGKGFTHLKNMVVSRGEIPDLAASRRLIEELCKAGRTRMAAQVVEFLECSHGTILADVRIYNELILGLCKAGEIDNALNLFHGIRCSPDAYTYNILTDGVFRERGFEEGVKFLDEMKRSKGFEPDAVTRAIVINWLCKEGRLDEAVVLINSEGWAPCVESYNAVMNGLCEAGRFMDAENLLADMAAREDECSPNAVTFRILINSLCHKGLLRKAIDLLESMIPQYGCAPNPCHYKIIIYSLCREKKLDRAMDCIEVMISRGCYPNIAVFNTLLAALWKEDTKLDAASELFNELKSSRCCSANEASYRIVIEGLARVGRGYEAMQVLNEMLCEEGFEPGAHTYTMLISSLVMERKCGDVMEVLEILEGLQVEFPCFSYNQIISAMCRAGETDRAIDVLVYIARKGCKPSRATYANLIEGVAMCGLCREAMELLNEMNLRGALDQGWIRGVTARIERICRLD